MSNFEPLPTQPNWRGQYSPFSLSGDGGLPQPSFEQASSPAVTGSNQNQEHSSKRPHLKHRHSLGPLKQDHRPPPIIERPDSAPLDAYKQGNNSLHDNALVLIESKALSLGSIESNARNSAPIAPQQEILADDNEGDALIEFKDEEDEEDYDDEMLDTEEGGDGGVPQTAAERRAERRKMKRFRLTHQQTRFLMSEFAKQAHPDAAHRDRLSREIPGLTPRQVQVWFQNRRAKIKRLTADDRDRMMRMRAVPDDFDNVQALHSPYGAVHGIATPLQSPVDFVPTYTDHMIRPLMVDTMQRNEKDDQVSPTGLSPVFGNVGFAPPGSMGTPDILSPLSLNSNDRYYPSHLSSPISAGPRSSNPFDRQNGYGALSHSRQHVRPLQPLQLRETMSRSRSESINSPLRSSMSWKGETLDYGNYQTGQSSPGVRSRQHSLYQADQVGNDPVNAHQDYGSTYSSLSQASAGFQPGAEDTATLTLFIDMTMQSSPTHTTYPPSHGPSSSLQQPSPSAMSRLRASSLALMPGLDLRNQYSAFPSQQTPTHGNPPQPRHNSFANSFTSGYASAPLTTPIDFSLPRTPVDGGQGAREFNIPQLSAPMAAPQDFQTAYHLSRGPNRAQQGDGNFGRQGQISGDPGNQRYGQTTDQGQQHQHQHQQQSSRRNENAPYPSSMGYEAGQEQEKKFQGA